MQYKNLIAQYNPTAMYSLEYEYYELLQIILSKILHMYVIWSQLFFTVVHNLSFLKNLNCSS